MQFIVTISNDKHVLRLESKDDTVFIARLTSIIVHELQAYNPDVTRNSVRVRELPPNPTLQDTQFSNKLT